MPVRTRLGAIALFFFIYHAIVDSWDWWSRANGLDPYFGAKADTGLGHFLRAIFDVNPLLVFCFIFIFGVMWATEPYWPLVKEQNGELQTTSHNVNGTDYGVGRTALVIALDDERRKREQAERERDTAKQVKDHAITSMQTAIQGVEKQRDEACREAFKWLDVTNFVVSYSRLTGLKSILEDAARTMDTRLPPRGQPRLSSVAEQLLRSGKVNEQEFEDLRPRLIQVVTEMRTQHGLSSAHLADDKITCAVYGSRQVREMIEGIETIATSLRDLIADAAVKAVDYKASNE